MCVCMICRETLKQTKKHLHFADGCLWYCSRHLIPSKPKIGSGICLLLSSLSIQCPKLPFLNTTMCHQKQTFLLPFVGSVHGNQKRRLSCVEQRRKLYESNALLLHWPHTDAIVWSSLWDCHVFLQFSESSLNVLPQNNSQSDRMLSYNRNLFVSHLTMCNDALLTGHDLKNVMRMMSCSLFERCSFFLGSVSFCIHNLKLDNCLPLTIFFFLFSLSIL